MPWYLWVQLALLGVVLYTFVAVVIAKLHWHLWPEYKYGTGNRKDVPDRDASWVVGGFWPATFPVMLGVWASQSIDFGKPEEKS